MKVSRLPISLKETLQCTCFPRPAILGRQRAFEIRPRQFTTTSMAQMAQGRFAAAPPVKFPRQGGNTNFQGRNNQDDISEERGEPEEEPTFYARVIPRSRSYFTAQPVFTDDLLVLRQLVLKYQNLPTVKPGEQPRVSWRALAEYRDQVGETVKASKYQKILRLLVQLNYIHPSLMPEDVRDAINEYRRDIDTYKNVKRPVPVDNMGRTLGAGRRKAATARAWLVEGNGEVLVNGKPLTEAFGRVHDRESVIWALKATNRIDKYNVWGLSQGGGTTGQAEALTLAIGKALMAHEPALKPALRRGKFSCSIVENVGKTCLLTIITAGCLTRDPKRVERKKPGKEKARKMPAWVKR
jgi:small subunit ribosomal protein S9